MSCSEEVAFYDGLRQRLIFFGHFFCKYFDCHSVYWHLNLPFNKCVTPTRLALSHRVEKMLKNAKIRSMSDLINELKNL